MDYLLFNILGSLSSYDLEKFLITKLKIFSRNNNFNSTTNDFGISLHLKRRIQFLPIFILVQSLLLQLSGISSFGFQLRNTPGVKSDKNYLRVALIIGLFLVSFIQWNQWRRHDDNDAELDVTDLLFFFQINLFLATLIFHGCLLSRLPPIIDDNGRLFNKRGDSARSTSSSILAEIEEEWDKFEMLNWIGAGLYLTILIIFHLSLWSIVILQYIK